MTKADLVVAVAEEVGISKKDAANAVDILFERIQAALEQGEDVKLSGFGAFVVKTRKERRGTSPKTGEEIVIPATKTVGFKPSKSLKDAIK